MVISGEMSVSGLGSARALGKGPGSAAPGQRTVRTRSSGLCGRVSLGLGLPRPRPCGPLCPPGHPRGDGGPLWAPVLARGPARPSQCDAWLDTWGPGTLVTVSSGESCAGPAAAAALGEVGVGSGGISEARKGSRGPPAPPQGRERGSPARERAAGRPAASLGPRSPGRPGLWARAGGRAAGPGFAGPGAGLRDWGGRLPRGARRPCGPGTPVSVG